MATLAFAALGSAVGGSIGGTLLGVSAAAIGQAVGATIGRAVDTALLNGSSTIKREGARIDNLDTLTSIEGAPLADVMGRVAISGEVIWATKLKETSRVESEKVGSGKQKQRVETTLFDYSVSFAISLGEGPFLDFGRIWANDKLADLTDLIADGRVRFYTGSEDQMPDPLIEAVEGFAPAYRGVAYMVVEDLPLEEWNNQIPQIKVEVWGQSGEMETQVRGVCVIPAATEWGYMPTVIDRQQTAENGDVISGTAENAVRYDGLSDWQVSIDQLEKILPNSDTASLVVSWFGSDMRAGQCKIEPRIESRGKLTSTTWKVGGHSPETATLVSTDDEGRPAFGSTPSDQSVIEAIRDLKARGQRVVLYPFVMMDVQADQSLPHPSGEGIQPDYPWRGRIEPDAGASVSAEIAAFLGTAQPGDFTISGDSVNFYVPQPVVEDTGGGGGGGGGGTGPGTFADNYIGNELEDAGGNIVSIHSLGQVLDTTSTTVRVNNLGEIVRGHDTPYQLTMGEVFRDLSGNFYTVVSTAQYVAGSGGNTSGGDTGGGGGEPVEQPPELSPGFRRFILHLAYLAKVAGGVDAFLIGSEMRGVTMAPSSPGYYPFVQGLKVLAADVAGILPDAKISYAADWSEYHSHQDGNDLRFHLDPLWADENIDFVGIDNYLPLSDWRSGKNHLDFDDALGHTTPYALDYLKGNIEGGEYWDWYYASEADRDTQTRTPITDGAYDEPWVYRQKAIRDWHANAHHERTGGTRASTPTNWAAASKPIWFTETGCPSVDMGANRPNVFTSLDSSEGALPWYSSGARDDFIQRQYIRAMMEWWGENGGTAVHAGDIQVWCWDSRPWPEFPQQTSLWSDGPNWYLGHWLNGRAGAAPLAEAISRRLIKYHGLTADEFDVGACYGQADGYPAAAPLGFRDYMQPLEVGMGLQAHERGGKLIIETRGAVATTPTTVEAAMVETGNGSPYVKKRTAIEDFATRAILKFIDGAGEYETVATQAIMGAGLTQGTATASLQLVFDFERGTAAVERILRSAADGRETITYRMPRSATHIRPGLVVPVRVDGQGVMPMIVDRVTDGADLTVEAKSFNYGSFASSGGVFHPAAAQGVRGSSLVLSRFLDLPPLPGTIASDWDTLVAFHADPWPGGVAFARSSAGDGGFLTAGASPARANMGETVGTLPAGGLGTYQSAKLTVKMFSGNLVTRPEIDVLSGQNALAIQHPDGWEVLQFTKADLVGGNTYQITGLLRGRLGTDAVIGMDALASGANVVVLNAALQPLGLEVADVGVPLFYRYGPSSTSVTEHNVRQHAGTAAGWRPYAPCHLAATETGGDLAFSWVRRTRVDGDADWRDGIATVPLGETLERYAVEIVSGGTVRHTAEVTTPGFTYTAAMATADGASAPYTLRVAQVSETYGPGAWSTLEIS